MARSRLELDSVLRELLGSSNLYFEPPSSVKIKYPCIVYERDHINSVCADDIKYLINKRYTITAIYCDPDDELPDKIISLPMCSHDRHFVSDNLQHDVFTIYY